jgi:TRAP-type C4-dicarboxylate transport system permease large subunit
MTRRAPLIVFVILATLAPGSASADMGSIANSVRTELVALVGPAILIAIIWFGILILTKRASLLAFFILVIGAVMLRSGGFF